MEMNTVETSKTVLGPMASVSVSVCRTAISIVFQHRRGSLIDGHAATRTLVKAFEQSQNREDDIKVVFLWAVGHDGPVHDENTLDLHELPGLDAKAPGGARVDIPQGGLDTLWKAIDAISQPVIGLGGGAISATGTRLLASCDLVIANRSAEFLPTMLTNVGVDVAWGTGFVSYVLDTTVALIQECERLRELFSGHSALDLVQVKQDLRTSRVSRLGTKGSQNQCDEGSGESGISTCSTPPDEADVPLPPYPNFLTKSKQTKLVDLMASLPSASTSLSSNGFDDEEKVAAQTKRTHTTAARKRSLASKFNSYDGPITTLMLSNIPCRVTQAQMVTILDGLGFGDSYDLLYLPVGKPGKPTNKPSASNLGYGFVNFIHPDEAIHFADVFQAYCFEGTNSSKTCTVRPAHIQGLPSFLQHFQRNPRKHLPPGPLVQFGGSLKEVTA